MGLGKTQDLNIRATPAAVDTASESSEVFIDLAWPSTLRSAVDMFLALAHPCARPGMYGPRCVRAARLLALALCVAKTARVHPRIVQTYQLLPRLQTRCARSGAGASIHPSRRPILTALLSGAMCGQAESVLAGVPRGMGTSHVHFDAHI